MFNKRIIFIGLLLSSVVLYKLYTSKTDSDSPEIIQEDNDA